ncbi:MAG: (2Fe-2S)-binding protein [Acidobacteria bacterium]|nr:(2Fe-2S)-binding protein [Acidobacteriota bacterium]
MSQKTVSHTLRVNGSTHVLELRPAERLIDVLRDRLGLIGTKEGCRMGECGSCTVLVGGRPMLSCLILALRVTDAVETIEGLAAESRPLREAFADAGAFQCGFCTPGQIVRAVALLREGLPLDEHGLRREMSGNICRCTGYMGIIAALRRIQALKIG